MDSKTNDVKEFFDEAVKIKEQRGKNYDNGGKSAFERSMDMFDDGNSTLSLSDAIKSMDDTSKDLVNYTAMQWVRNVKPYLKKGEQK